MNSLRLLPFNRIVVLALFTVLAFNFFLTGCAKQKEKQVPRFSSWSPEADKKADTPFKDAFDEYWLARSKLDWPKLYAMEAPHIKWAYSDADFFRKFGRASKVLSVTVLDIDKLHPKVVDARLKIVVKSSITGREEILYPRDRWIKVGGRWYHVWKIPLLDKFA